MSRITRNTRRLAQLDDDDADLVLRLSQSQSSHADLLEEDDDLHLLLSQTQNTQLNSSAVSDLTSSTNNIQVNIARIVQVIKQNHGVFAKHDVLLNLVSDISVNVAEIGGRVNKLEKRQCNLQKTINNNKDMLDEVTTDLEKVKKSIRIIKQKQSQSIKHDEFEDRLKIVEARLKKQGNNVTSNKYDNDAVLLVKNLPYGMKDDEDAQLLLSDGLGLNIRIRSTH